MPQRTMGCFQLLIVLFCAMSCEAEFSLRVGGQNVNLVLNGQQTQKTIQCVAANGIKMGLKLHGHRNTSLKSADDSFWKDPDPHSTCKVGKFTKDCSMPFHDNEGCRRSIDFEFSFNVYENDCDNRVEIQGSPFSFNMSLCSEVASEPCSLKCSNGGTCIKTAKRDKCVCPDGWGGRTCAKAVCNPRCLNGGSCRFPNQCKCARDFEGHRCEQPICTPGCENGGSCVSTQDGTHQCSCLIGYAGQQCEKPICKDSCENNGTCISPGICACAEGYTGPTCAVEVCKESPTFSVTPHHAGYQINSTAMLHCHADGCSPTVISWHFHGDKIGGILPNGTLVIPKFQMEDVGMYTCVAQNDGGRSEAEAVLYPYFVFRRGSGSGSGSASGHGFFDDEDNNYYDHPYGN